MFKYYFYSVLAAGGNLPTGSGVQTINITNPINSSTLEELVNQLLDLVIKIGTPILVLAIIYVGFLFVTARGNAAQIENAKKSLWWTIIGAAIVLGAFVISTAIKTTIGNL